MQQCKNFFLHLFSVFNYLWAILLDFSFCLSSLSFFFSVFILSFPFLLHFKIIFSLGFTLKEVSAFEACDELLHSGCC